MVTGRTYLERGEPVVVMIRWVTLPPATAAVIWHRPPRRNAPRNVLIERAPGTLVVRPFRGLRRCPDTPPPRHSLGLARRRVGATGRARRSQPPCSRSPAPGRRYVS
jgi:acetyl esterase